MVAYSILVSAQGPLVLVLGLRGLGLRVWGQGLTIREERHLTRHSPHNVTAVIVSGNHQRSHHLPLLVLIITATKYFLINTHLQPDPGPLLLDDGVHTELSRPHHRRDQFLNTEYDAMRDVSVCVI